MALDVDDLTSSMVAAARGAFTGCWQQIEHYTIPELEKVASTIVSIETHVVAGTYTRQVGDLILRMQLRATQSVLVATTGLLLLQVEKALNQILKAVAGVVNTAIGFPLIAGI